MTPSKLLRTYDDARVTPSRVKRLTAIRPDVLGMHAVAFERIRTYDKWPCISGTIFRYTAGMGILIGMDEAGYGPNLGPLVVAATAWEVGEEARGPRSGGRR